MSRHAATTVALTFSLLVPVFGTLTSAWVVLGGSGRQLEAVGAGLVIAGLVVNVFGPRPPGRA